MILLIRMGRSADLTPRQIEGLAAGRKVLGEFHSQIKGTSIGIGETYTFPQHNDHLELPVSSELIEEQDGALVLAHSGTLENADDRNSRRVHRTIMVRPSSDGGIQILAGQRTKELNEHIATQPIITFTASDEVRLIGDDLTEENVRRKLEELRAEPKHAPQLPQRSRGQILHHSMSID